jgi:hypothetical protein
VSNGVTRTYAAGTVSFPGNVVIGEKAHEVLGAGMFCHIDHIETKLSQLFGIPELARGSSDFANSPLSCEDLDLKVFQLGLGVCSSVLVVALRGPGVQ